MIQLSDHEKSIIKDGKALLGRNDIGGFVASIHNSTDRGHIVQFLYEKGIDVLEYVGSTVYPRMFSAVELPGVHIPENITTIDREAFAGSKVGSIDFSEASNLTAIRASAFEYCSNLTSVRLPEGLTFLGARAFANCSNLKEVYIPDSLRKLDAEIFEGCPDNIVIYASHRDESNKLSCKAGDLEFYKAHLKEKNN